MKRLLIALACAVIGPGAGACALSAQVPATSAPHTFSLDTAQFLLDGRPFQVRACEIHPARVPPEYWEHRVRMARAMGCNTIAAYVFWNFHEPAEGVFDFSLVRRICG